MRKFKTLQELRGFSSIDVTSKSFEEIVDYVQENKGNMGGGIPLNYGVLIIRMDGSMFGIPKVLQEEFNKCRFYLHYVIVEENGNLEILLESYLYDVEHICVNPLNASIIRCGGNGVSTEVLNNYVVENERMTHRLMREHFSTKGVQILQDMLLQTLTYIDLVQANKKVIYKQSKGMSYASSSDTNKKKKKSNYEKVQVLNEDKVMYVISGNKDTIKTFREYTRHTEAWGVVGHYRHYKNGLVSWVNSYIKGEGKLKSKNYKVK